MINILKMNNMKTPNVKEDAAIGRKAKDLVTILAFYITIDETIKSLAVRGSINTIIQLTLVKCTNLEKNEKNMLPAPTFEPKTF